jgi:hypothetical protein
MITVSEQRDQRQRPTEPQWALRILVFSIVLVILNFVFLLRGTNSTLAFIDNVLATSILVLFWSLIGEYLDKKLTYLSLLVFNKLEKSGLITVIEQDIPEIRKQDSEKPQALEKKKGAKTAYNSKSFP